MITRITYTDDLTPDDEYRWERSKVEPFHWSLAIRTKGGEWRLIRPANDADPHTTMEVLWNVALGTTQENDRDTGSGSLDESGGANDDIVTS